MGGQEEAAGQSEVAAEEAASATPADQSLEDRATQACIWCHRVSEWSRLQRVALERDSVPAPGNSGKRWLLYKHRDDLTVQDEAIH